MNQDMGVAASPPGHSAEPEPSCTVSALRASVPNAGWVRSKGIRKAWVRDGVTLDSAGEMARLYGAPKTWGEPIDAYVWTEETWHDEWDCDSFTRAFACLYANGRVVDVRINKRFSSTNFYESPVAAQTAMRPTSSSREKDQ